MVGAEVITEILFRVLDDACKPDYGRHGTCIGTVVQREKRFPVFLGFLWCVDV